MQKRLDKPLRGIIYSVRVCHTSEHLRAKAALERKPARFPLMGKNFPIDKIVKYPVVLTQDAMNSDKIRRVPANSTTEPKLSHHITQED